MQAAIATCLRDPSGHLDTQQTATLLQQMLARHTDGGQAAEENSMHEDPHQKHQAPIETADE